MLKSSPPFWLLNTFILNVRFLVLNCLLVSSLYSLTWSAKKASPSISRSSVFYYKAINGLILITGPSYYCLFSSCLISYWRIFEFMLSRSCSMDWSLICCMFMTEEAPSDLPLPNIKLILSVGALLYSSLSLVLSNPFSFASFFSFSFFSRKPAYTPNCNLAMRSWFCSSTSCLRLLSLASVFSSWLVGTAKYSGASASIWSVFKGLWKKQLTKFLTRHSTL